MTHKTIDFYPFLYRNNNNNILIKLGLKIWIIFSVILLLFSLIWGITVWRQEKKINILNEQNQFWEKKLSLIKVNYSNLVSFDISPDLLDKLKKFQERNHKQYWLSFAKIIEPGVWLEEINIPTDGKISLLGKAISVKPILKVLKNMDHDPTFTGKNLPKLTVDKITQIPEELKLKGIDNLYQFKIDIL